MGGRSPGDGPRDYEIGYGKPPVATRFKKGNRANPQGRPRVSTSLATLLQQALDAPAPKSEGKRRRPTKRELMIRALVERSAGADLAATKLLFEMMRRTDPRTLAPEPAEAGPLGNDALALLKERLARLARAQLNPTAPQSDASDPADPVAPPDADRT